MTVFARYVAAGTAPAVDQVEVDAAGTTTGVAEQENLKPDDQSRTTEREDDKEDEVDGGVCSIKGACRKQHGADQDIDHAEQPALVAHGHGRELPRRGWK